MDHVAQWKALCSEAESDATDFARQCPRHSDDILRESAEFRNQSEPADLNEVLSRQTAYYGLRGKWANTTLAERARALGMPRAD